MRGWAKGGATILGVMALACAGAKAPTVNQGWSTPEFVVIPAGTFQMGVEGDSDAQPHPVTLSAFEIMKREVTVAEWTALMGALPLGNHACSDAARCPPIQGVTWREAVSFANAASERDGLQPAYVLDGDQVTWDRAANGYRLPTEAEWEYTARGPADAPAPTGADAGWFKNNCEEAHPACEKPAGGYGTCDMLGNVAEYVFDDFVAYYPTTPQTDPVVQREASPYVVVRGGSWFSTLQEIQPGTRSFKPRDKDVLPPLGVGFRLAREPGAGARL